MLKFIYGVMGSSKSAQALITRHNYIQNGFDVILIKPSVDDRFDEETRMVRSRIGLSARCDVFDHETDLKSFLFNSTQNKNPLFGGKCIIIVDEVQFCTKQQIDQLKELSSMIDIFCYGLRTNFKSELFEGSKRLFELADELENISHICKCGKQALINARFKDDQICLDGEEIQIGDIEYKPLCYTCYQLEIKNRRVK